MSASGEPTVLDCLFEKARALQRRIILAEGGDERIAQAAVEVVRQGLASLTVLGDPDIVASQIRSAGGNPDAIEIIDPAKSEHRGRYAQTLYELRQKKGMEQEEAFHLAGTNLYFPVLAIKCGDADGLVSGATHSTANTVRPALQVLKTAPGFSLVSSCFLMLLPDRSFGVNGALIFADCGLVINPDKDELAEIAISAARSFRQLVGPNPRVAMLSFSSKGSARHEWPEKVAHATAIVRQREPDLLVDGELQADAALVPWVAEKKAPGSPVEGRANILIFPNLAAGNIAYKLTERLAKASALGPILQGVARPVNDLSRGCSTTDIIRMVAITACQSGSLAAKAPPVSL